MRTLQDALICRAATIRPLRFRLSKDQLMFYWFYSDQKVREPEYSLAYVRAASTRSNGLEYTRKVFPREEFYEGFLFARTVVAGIFRISL